MKIFRKILLFFAAFFVLSSCSQKKLVSAQINFMQPYCGGARPTPEIIKDSETPRPYANKTIVFVSSTGKTDSVKTNAAGLFSAKLKIGDYKLYEAWRYYKKADGGMVVSDFDVECLKEEWQKEIKIVTVTKTEIKFSEKNEIIEVCPWNLPCILESHRPPARE
ncbi:MAG: hypothetical protein JNJ40_02335 [Bacteroidia bacterium]|nr:hypothetical protein [Bacteroidia bacterium]